MDAIWNEFVYNGQSGVNLLQKNTCAEIEVLMFCHLKTRYCVSNSSMEITINCAKTLQIPKLGIIVFIESYYVRRDSSLRNTQ